MPLPFTVHALPFMPLPFTFHALTLYLSCPHPLPSMLKLKPARYMTASV